MRRIELVVFDWDGTLVDSTAAIADAIRAAAADLGLPVPTQEQASHVIGLGLHDALRLAVPELQSADIPAFVERYRAHYLHRDLELRPFEGVERLLGALGEGGHPLAIATGKSRAGLNRALEQTGWAARFAATRCADEGHPKPHPWMLLDLCEQLGVDPAATAMVGDTTHDLAMARDAGAMGVAVLYGAHPEQALRDFGPAGVLGSVDELSGWLLERLAPRPPRTR